MSKYTMTAQQWGLLVLIAVIWGMSFFFTKLALRELGPFTLVFYRLLLAASVTCMVLFLSGQRLPMDILSWRRFFMLGAFNACVPFTLVSIGQVYIDSSLASILNATAPIFTVIMAHYLTEDEKINAHRLAGVVLAFAGVVLLIGPGSLASMTSNYIGQLAMFGAVMSYSYSSIYAKNVSDMPILPTMTGTLVTACLLSYPLAFLLEYPLVTDIHAPTIGAVLFISLMATSFAYLLYFHVIRTAGATNTLLLVFLIPVTAILMGVVILDESVDARMIAGMLIVFCALVLVDGRVLRSLLARA